MIVGANPAVAAAVALGARFLVPRPMRDRGSRRGLWVGPAEGAAAGGRPRRPMVRRVVGRYPNGPHRRLDPSIGSVDG